MGTDLLAVLLCFAGISLVSGSSIEKRESEESAPSREKRGKSFNKVFFSFFVVFYS